MGEGRGGGTCVFNHAQCMIRRELRQSSEKGVSCDLFVGPAHVATRSEALRGKPNVHWTRDSGLKQRVQN